MRGHISTIVVQYVSVYFLGADDIIRQHKSACLRITALLTCKDLLWMGTSAGVLLTLPMPKVTTATEKSSVQAPTVTGMHSVLYSSGVVGIWGLVHYSFVLYLSVFSV